MKSLYKWLDISSVYLLAQSLLAPGSQEYIHIQIGQVLANIPKGILHLDVGCGPRSHLAPFNLSIVGLDITESYIKNLISNENCAGVVGSADRLPFVNERFGAVWSIGIFHHLPDDVARATIAECIRVCEPKGVIAIFDAVLPKRPFLSPLAYILRKADRGRYVRTQKNFEALFAEPSSRQWTFARLPYSTTGLETILALSSNQ